jgi:hypothetical protein
LRLPNPGIGRKCRLLAERDFHLPVQEKVILLEEHYPSRCVQQQDRIDTEPLQCVIFEFLLDGRPMPHETVSWIPCGVVVGGSRQAGNIIIERIVRPFDGAPRLVILQPQEASQHQYTGCGIQRDRQPNDSQEDNRKRFLAQAHFQIQNLGVNRRHCSAAFCPDCTLLTSGINSNTLRGKGAG